MACNDVLDAQTGSTTIESLPSEDTAVSAVALLPDLGDDLVHCPAVELVVADYGEWHVILDCISLHGLKGVISITFYAFVDGEEEEIEAIVVAFIEGFEDGGQDGGVFTSRSANGNAFTGAEEGIGGDGVVNFGLEEGEEAILAELLVVFRTDDEGTGGVAESTERGWHGISDLTVSWYFRLSAI